MAKCLVGAAGGLSAADKAKLIPENLRDGLKLFEGTSREVVGNLLPAENLVVLMFSASKKPNIAGQFCVYQDGAYTAWFYNEHPSGVVPGTVKRVIIGFTESGVNVCGHTSPGIYDTEHTNNFTFPGNANVAFVVLGKVE